MPDQENVVTIENFSKESLREDEDLRLIAISFVADLETVDEGEINDALDRIGSRYDAFVVEILERYHLDPDWLELFIGRLISGEIEDLRDESIPAHLTGTINRHNFRDAEVFTDFYQEVVGSIANRYMDYARIMGERGHLGAQYVFWSMARGHVDFFRRSFRGDDFAKARYLHEEKVRRIGDKDFEYLILEIMEEIFSGPQPFEASHMDLVRLAEINSLLDTEEESDLEEPQQEIVDQVGQFYSDQVIQIMRESELDAEEVANVIGGLAEREIEDMIEMRFHAHITDLEWGTDSIIDYGVINEDPLNHGYIYHNSHKGVIGRYMEYSRLMGRYGYPAAQYYFWQLAVSHADLYTRFFLQREGEYLDEIVTRGSMGVLYADLLEQYEEELLAE